MPEGISVEQYEQALTTINLVGNSDVIWFAFVLVGWGIGILIHNLTEVRWSGPTSDATRRRWSTTLSAAPGETGAITPTA